MILLVLYLPDNGVSRRRNMPVYADTAPTRCEEVPRIQKVLRVPLEVFGWGQHWMDGAHPLVGFGGDDSPVSTMLRVL